MQRMRIAIACIFAILISACASLEGRYFREGIGTDLYWSGLPEASRLEDFYIGYICQQAGLPVVFEGDYVLCATGFGPSEWSLFFQAGMNDIDRRCDAYLAWLDNKRRLRAPILQQISDTQTATLGILKAAGAGATPITIAGLAFGLATDTFTNISSRLVLEVDHTTVQAVVLGNQATFRADNVDRRIDNRPAALYLLRRYLRLCMPYTIEMSINTTVTVYHRDPEALAAPPILLRTSVPMSGAHTRDVGAPSGRTRWVEDSPSKRPAPTASPVTLEDYKEIIANYDPTVHTITKVEPALVKLCVPKDELRKIGENTKLLIRIYQIVATPSNVTGKLRTRDIANIEGIPGDCAAGRLNYYEAYVLKGEINSLENIDLLNVALPKDSQIPKSATIDTVRSRIADIRSTPTLRSKLKLQSGLLANQITSDLIAELQRMSLTQPTSN